MSSKALQWWNSRKERIIKSQRLLPRANAPTRENISPNRLNNNNPE